jgi:hypothetical protein
MVIQKRMQLRNRHYWKDLENIQGVGLDVEAHATAEQVVLKRPLHFFFDFGHLKVDATAQQAFSKDPKNFSHRNSGSSSWRNSATDVFEKNPSKFFGSMVIQKRTQLRNRHYRKDLENIQGVGLNLEADATAEQVFLKRPLHFFVGFWSPLSGCNCATGIFWRSQRIVIEETLEVQRLMM